MPYRILILETVRDAAASRREMRIRSAPALQEHQFEHMYASERAALDETMPMPARLVRSQLKSLDENALLERVHAQVTAFHADILLVHSGALFQSYPDETQYVLQTVKALHPALRIGFQPRSFERYGPRACVEYSNEMGDLMARIFGEGRAAG